MIFSTEPNAQKVLKIQDFRDNKCYYDSFERKTYYIFTIMAQASGFEVKSDILAFYFVKPDYIEAKCDFQVESKKVELTFVIDADIFPIMKGVQIPTEFTKYKDIQIEGWKDAYHGELKNDECHPNFGNTFSMEDDPKYFSANNSVVFKGTFDGESSYFELIPILAENEFSFMNCNLFKSSNSNEPTLICSVNIGDKKTRFFPTIKYDVLFNIDYSVNGESKLVQNIWLFMILLIILF